jgi:hypothetical protein
VSKYGTVILTAPSDKELRMFFLKIKGSDLERLSKLANRRSTSIEAVTREVFVRGLQCIESFERPQDPADPSLPELPYRSRPQAGFEACAAYIRSHWKEESDEYMAEILGERVGQVGYVRREMGLLRQRGGNRRLTEKDTGSEPDSKVPLPRRHRKTERLESLIRMHWLTHTDREIGKLMDPPVSRAAVALCRYALGLKREVKNGMSQKRGVVRIGQAIDPAEFERMVLHEGYTMVDYMKHVGVSCTRERFRQVVEDLGLKHSPSDRTAGWKLKNRARKLNLPALADREWLAAQLETTESIPSLAAKLGVEVRTLFFFIRSFNLTHPSFRKHGTQRVELVCVNCGATFLRLKSLVKRQMKRNPEKPSEFFCGLSCTGQYNRERAARRSGSKKLVEPVS